MRVNQGQEFVIGGYSPFGVCCLASLWPNNGIAPKKRIKTNPNSETELCNWWPIVDLRGV
jgi:hypothetical protein